MEAERNQVAPAREERSADVCRSDGNALGRLAPGPSRVPGTANRRWGPADVAALQRTAGNAVVARLLATGNRSTVPVKGAARGVIQRELATNPDDIPTDVGPNEDRPILIRLKDALKAYYGARRSEERYSLLNMMLRNIADWFTAYKASTSKKAASGKASRLNFKLGLFKDEIEKELPEAKRDADYVEYVRLGKFEYTSFESKGQARDTAKLLGGETDIAQALKGMGPEALRIVREAGLTEPETLALKVYTVGDYRAINATLGLWDDTRLTTALHEMGLVKDDQGVPVLPAERFAPQDPAEQPSWQARKTKFAKYEPFFKPDLAKVKAEARQHAAILDRAFRKLPAFDSSKTGKKTWRGVRLDPMWQDYKDYTTKDAVVTNKPYVSTSKNRGVAEKFAWKKGPDGRVGFLLECTLKNGRDLELISYHGKEQEVLMLPGSRVRVDQVIPMQPTMPYDYLVRVTEL